MGKFIAFLVFLIIMVFLVYFAVTRKIPLPIPNLKFATPTITTRPNSRLVPGGTGWWGTSTGRIGSGQTSSITGISGQGNSTSTINPADVPSGFTVKDISPYFKKVRLGSVYPGSFENNSLVSLYYAGQYGSRETINVSGWKIQGNRGSQVAPKAVNVYDPSGLSEETDVFLESGETFYIYSGVSPIGRNLRLNKCVGYLERTATFVPSLGRSCPDVERAEVARFTGVCQNYINSLGCKFPDSNPPVRDDYACRSFLEQFNYGGCFSRHRAETDFLSHEWRAWTGPGPRFLDPLHDRVLLLDQNGLLVDIYTY